jgi:hypothetical protein
MMWACGALSREVERHAARLGKSNLGVTGVEDVAHDGVSATRRHENEFRVDAEIEIRNLGAAVPKNRP